VRQTARVLAVSMTELLGEDVQIKRARQNRFNGQSAQRF